MITRSLEKTILQEAKGFPAIALVGPRQSGKTTLAKKLFPHHQYISLEALDIRHRANSDPRGFLRDLDKNVILDEIQRVPDLFSYLQEWLDSGENHAVLTGSHQFFLLEAITQSLAGRVAQFEILPFSWSELQKRPNQQPFRSIERFFSRKKPTQSTLDVILKGFYPRIHDKNLSASRWLSSYLTSYVERDVRQITQITNLSAFSLMIKLLASQCGSVLNLTPLSVQTGISLPTMKRWIHILELSGLIFLLPPYYKNFRKRLLKTPKIYFIDTGLLCHLLGIRNANHLKLHPLRGNIFENFVVSEHIKQFYHNGEKPALWYWRDNHGLEVDLLLESNNIILPIEIKSTATWKNDLGKGIENWLELPENTSKSGLVIYDGDHIVGQKEKICAAPWWSCF